MVLKVPQGGVGVPVFQRFRRHRPRPSLMTYVIAWLRKDKKNGITERS